MQFKFIYSRIEEKNIEEEEAKQYIANISKTLDNYQIPILSIITKQNTTMLMLLYNNKSQG